MKKYGISSHTLRYYERIGLIPVVCRTGGGRRDYKEDDCSWVEFIKCMRSAGLSVEVLIEYVAMCQQGDSTHNTRKELLIEQRRQLLDRMQDMKETLERLNAKINNYDSIITPAETSLPEK